MPVGRIGWGQAVVCRCAPADADDLRQVQHLSRPARFLRGIGRVRHVGDRGPAELPERAAPVSGHDRGIRHSTNAEGHVNTLYRNSEKTVGQPHEEIRQGGLVKRFNPLPTRGKWDAWVPIIHAIEPRVPEDAQSAMRGTCDSSRFYWEVGGDGDGFFESPGSTTSRPCARVGPPAEETSTATARPWKPSATSANYNTSNCGSRGHRLHDKAAVAGPSSLKNGKSTGFPAALRSWT